MGPELSLFGTDTWYHTEAVSPSFPEYFRREKQKDKSSRQIKIKLWSGLKKIK